MKKKLTPESVEFIVVHASHTNVHQDLTPDDILEKRKKAGYPDIGFHCVITRDGKHHPGVSIQEVGTHTTRFNTCSVGVLLIGGKTTRGKPSDNYTPAQKAALRGTLVALKAVFTKATIVGAGQLLGGTSPHTDLEEILNGTERQDSEAPSETQENHQR